MIDTSSLIGLFSPGKENIKLIHCMEEKKHNKTAKILVSEFTSAPRVRDLLTLGNIRKLGTRLIPDEDQTETKELTVAFHRDMGRDLIPATTVPADENSMKATLLIYQTKRAFGFDPLSNHWFCFEEIGINTGVYRWYKL